MNFLNNKKLFILFGSLTFLFCLFLVNDAYAASPIFGDNSEVAYSQGCVEKGDCELNDFWRIGMNVTKWILGMVGSVTLLMFVYGGTVLLLSQGSPAKITEAKGVIVAAVVGLVIVFASYVIVGFIINAMGIEGSGWASSNWFQ